MKEANGAWFVDNIFSRNSMYCVAITNELNQFDKFIYDRRQKQQHHHINYKANERINT